MLIDGADPWWQENLPWLEAIQECLNTAKSRVDRLFYIQWHYEIMDRAQKDNHAWAGRGYEYPAGLF